MKLFINGENKLNTKLNDGKKIKIG